MTDQQIVNCFAILVFLGGGIFTLIAVALDWDLAKGGGKAARIVSLLGRTGARIFYAAFGSALVIVGSFIAWHTWNELQG